MDLISVVLLLPPNLLLALCEMIAILHLGFLDMRIFAKYFNIYSMFRAFGFSIHSDAEGYLGIFVLRPQ